MLDFFRGHRPWPQLYRLLARLPALSHFQRALADDDDLAEQRLDAASDGPPRQVRPGEWGPLDELVATITDATNAIRQTVVAVNTPKGKRPPQFKPSARPVTARERAERRRERQTIADIVAIATPHAAPPGDRTD